ncbi:MAG: acetyl-CoA C-acetyltransferase [Nevskia sp.]|jgi:acetyl-CoA C-acetyltransferase|nr:acetyl-CoA C-acetyltransferase [Nevskia sp.]
MEDVVIVAAARSAIGKFRGALSEIPAPQLGAEVIRALLARTNLPATAVDEVLMGQVLTAGSGQNPARQSALFAGLPHEVPAATINQVCGSGLRAVMLAAQAIRSGEASLVIAGGQENMSSAPHILPDTRKGKKIGDWTLRDSMVVDGLWDAFNDYHMSQTAENLAERYSITREQQDAYSARSQQRVEKAQAEGLFAAEIVPIKLQSERGVATDFLVDEQPRAGTTEATLAKLKPAFGSGTITAGNASSLNDGAAGLVLASASRARELSLPVLAIIRGHATTGVDPAYMGLGPVSSTRKCLQRAGWTLQDLDLIEANEAYAVQSLAIARELEWDLARVNVQGGAIALGHPLGASGARVLVTLVHSMIRRKARRGLATLCIGGGQGVALAVELP